MCLHSYTSQYFKLIRAWHFLLEEHVSLQFLFHGTLDATWETQGTAIIANWSNQASTWHYCLLYLLQLFLHFCQHKSYDPTIRCFKVGGLVQRRNLHYIHNLFYRWRVHLFVYFTGWVWGFFFSFLCSILFSFCSFVALMCEVSVHSYLK